MKKIILPLVTAITVTLLATSATAGEYNIIDRDRNPELYCLALNVYFESRGEPLEGQYAVADVTLNRADSEYFPDSICSVVYQRSQFSWTHQIQNSRNPRLRERQAWYLAQQVALEITELDIMRGITDGATYFHANYVQPRWRLSFEKTTRIGTHLFYRDPTRS
jgi:N-acetylmuramoyl-L-alanine amidase